MFPPMELGGEQLVLRPSLCPHHALIFRSRHRSQRELPLRIAELGGMYRAELSGVLGGLTRVRAIQLNDAHVFCTLDQVPGEAGAVLDMIDEAYAALGIRAARFRLSLRGPGADYVDDPPMWDRAEAMLTAVLEARGVAYDAEAGEGAFYGPKIDVQIADAHGREATLSTVQLDFCQPKRFGLRYTGPDQARNQPVMVHRSVIGGVERLVAQLIEVHAGAFPTWIAPVQLVLLPVSDAELPAASALLRDSIRRGLRTELLEPQRGTLGARVRAARRVPYQAVIGAKERAIGAVALRLRDGRNLGPLPAVDVLARISAAAASRTHALWDASEG
jgi:threonyl-tRNA synthetase